MYQLQNKEAFPGPEAGLGFLNLFLRLAAGKQVQLPPWEDGTR